MCLLVVREPLTCAQVGLNRAEVSVESQWLHTASSVFSDRSLNVVCFLHSS